MSQPVLSFRFCVPLILALGFVTSARDLHAQDYIINYGKKLPNGKVCRILLGETHWHTGNSADLNKARAKKRAILDWASFVIFEYGRSWGNWHAADKRAMNCAYDKDAAVWRCRAEAQPCKG